MRQAFRNRMRHVLPFPRPARRGESACQRHHLRRQLRPRQARPDPLWAGRATCRRPTSFPTRRPRAYGTARPSTPGSAASRSARGAGALLSAAFGKVFRRTSSSSPAPAYMPSSLRSSSSRAAATIRLTCRRPGRISRRGDRGRRQLIPVPLARRQWLGDGRRAAGGGDHAENPRYLSEQPLQSERLDGGSRDAEVGALISRAARL